MNQLEQNVWCWYNDFLVSKIVNFWVLLLSNLCGLEKLFYKVSLVIGVFPFSNWSNQLATDSRWDTKWLSKTAQTMVHGQLHRQLPYLLLYIISRNCSTYMEVLLHFSGMYTKPSLQNVRIWKSCGYDIHRVCNVVDDRFVNGPLHNSTFQKICCCSNSLHTNTYSNTHRKSKSWRKRFLILLSLDEIMAPERSFESYKIKLRYVPFQ